MKVGDLVRHNGGGGEGAAIGIIIGKHPEYGWWKVHELCGEYVGVTEKPAPRRTAGSLFQKVLDRSRSSGYITGVRRENERTDRPADL